MKTLLFGLLLLVAVGIAAGIFVSRRQFCRRNQGCGSVSAKQLRADEVPTEIPRNI